MNFTDDETDDDIEEPLRSLSGVEGGTSGGGQVVPRRKDLCKLLGLNENRVGELLILDDQQVKTAQKVRKNAINCCNPRTTVFLDFG